MVDPCVWINNVLEIKKSRNQHNKKALPGIYSIYKKRKKSDNPSLLRCAQKFWTKF